MSQTSRVLLWAPPFPLSGRGALRSVELRNDVMRLLCFTSPTPAAVCELGKNPEDWRTWGLYVDL